MKWLVLIHVLSAIIGVGPAFFGHVLFRRNQSLQELRFSLRMAKMLELFPKIGGTTAVLTGILLVVLYDYGSFLQLWLIGSLILYILIQIIVIAWIVPTVKELTRLSNEPADRAADTLSERETILLEKANRLHYAASALGVILFIFMILKP